jgi:tol-pal system protein YbgF
MNRLRDELSHVQADNDRFEQRLSQLEVESMPGSSSGSASGAMKDAPTLPATSNAVPPAPTPKLKVVHLGPSAPGDPPPGSPRAQENGSDPDDTTPRPVLRITGSGTSATVTQLQGKHRGHVDHIEETLPPEQPNGGSMGPAVANGGARPSALDENARHAYDAALQLVNQKRFPEALDAFAAFLVRWPDHPNADNAMYWRGESYFAQGEFARASEEFEGTIARFPLGNKVPDALLKLGISQQKLGNPQIAHAHFDRLRREFSKSDAAHRIPEENP